MKLLITGICGFVGASLATAIRELDSSIALVGIDNFSRSGSANNRERLRDLGIEIFHGDIRQASDVDALPPVEAVIDAAANASVLAGVGAGISSRQLIENNLLGTINLLEYCKRNLASFVLLSTSRVYSIRPLASLTADVVDGAFRPRLDGSVPGLTEAGISEQFSTAAPVSLYGATKLTSEQLAIEYGHAYRFPVWVNRCGVMAGAGQFGRPDQGIYAFWLHSWREGRPLKYIGFNGSGYQVRDCLHPRDLTELVIKQAQTANDGRSQIVNLSGGLGSARSLAQLSAWCAQRWSPAEVAADQTHRPYDLPWVVLDHALATHTWSWQPKISVDYILDEIADYADTNPNWISTSR